MVNQHFFKPLLPGFHNHLTIPVAFFVKYIEGRDDQQKTVELRSDASEIIWKVKIDGQRLTDGWKEFALAHDLRIGDIAVFRQERDLAFHVTILGPSCCEIQYGSCSDEESNIEKSPNREAETPSLDPSCFVANVAPSSLRYDLMHLPKAFVRENGIVTGSGEVVLINEKGRSWKLRLKQKPSCGSVYIRGWRSFCDANGLRAGDIVTFKLIQREGPLVLRLLAKEPKEEEANDVSLSTEPESDEENNVVKKNPNRYAESSSLDPSCFVANVSPSSLRYDALLLPRPFVRENGVLTGSGKIVLMNEKGISWNFKLKQKPSGRTVYIRGGWRSFCDANGLSVGDIFTFKMIQREGTLVLRLLAKEPKEEEANDVSLSAEPESDEENNVVKKNPNRYAESSLDPSCFVANVSPSSLRYDALYLPKCFMRENGLDIKCGEMILMNEKGESWTLVLKRKNSCGTTYIRGGWRSFCRANGLKAGSSSTFKLIQKEGTPVLRLTPNEPEEEECSEGNEVESLSTEHGSDKESSQDERISQECSIRKDKKSRLMWKASTSPSKNRFVTLTLTPYNMHRSVLRLPVPFTTMNGINEETKMTLLDKHGKKWSANLRLEHSRSKRLRMTGDWKEFFQANCVKTNDSAMLELIWEGDTSCILKFISKVKL